MITVIDNFNSYTDGNLNGQGPWSAGPADTTPLQVEGSVTQEGAKAVSGSGSNTDGDSVASVTARTSGTFGWYFRMSSGSTNATSINFYLRESTTTKFQIQLKGDQTAGIIGSGSTSIATGVTENAWHLFEVEIKASDDTARARIDGGTWTSFVAAASAYAQIDSIRVLFDSDVGASQLAYIDYIYYDDGVSGTNSGFFMFRK